jgi:hypothetical protein
MASAARIEADETDPLRDEIHARIDQLDRDFRLLSVGELCRRADMIRHLADGARMEVIRRLAIGLREAIAAGGRGAAVHPYFAGMREAVDLPAQDEAMARAFLASVSLRLAG